MGYGNSENTIFNPISRSKRIQVCGFRSSIFFLSQCLDGICEIFNKYTIIVPTFMIFSEQDAVRKTWLQGNRYNTNSGIKRLFHTVGACFIQWGKFGGNIYVTGSIRTKSQHTNTRIFGVNNELRKFCIAQSDGRLATVLSNFAYIRSQCDTRSSCKIYNS